MKPTREIIGLRIISISDGTQVGVVKDLVLNPRNKTLDFMMVDQPTDYLGAKVIAFQDILGMGEFAVTIPYQEIIQDVAQNAEAQTLLKQETRVLGTQVMTKKGQLVGEVKEILIDEETGKIAACLFESDGEMQEVGAKQIITLGKEILIIEAVPSVSNLQVVESGSEDSIQIPEEAGLFKEADVKEKITLGKEVDSVEGFEPVERTDSLGEFDLVERTDSLGEIDLVEKSDPLEEFDLVEETDSMGEFDLLEESDSLGELNLEEESDSIQNFDFEEADAADKLTFEEAEPEPLREPETSFNLFEQRQLQYFIDKMVEKDIILDNGEILRAGERITPEVVTHITTRSTLMEVTSHLRKN